jgi:hypothetical protein
VAQPKTSVERAIREYDLRIQALIRRSRVVRVEDVWRIRRAYSEFLREAVPFIAGQTGFGRAASEQLLRALALRVDELSNRVVGILRDGMTAQVELAQRGLGSYASAFTGHGSGLTALSISPAQLDALMHFSADLIGVRTGGIGAQMLQRVNSALRLAALGVGDQQQSIAAINRVLGGPAAWSYKAERIYVTETLRAASITTEQGIQDLNRRVPTGKKWMWSHIARQEHAAINGQIVAADKKFRVPLPATKSHGARTVLMRFPRDPAAPAAATVFCGCFLVAVPMTASGHSIAA